MAEAMATGTPVIATRRGSVPEVVREGVTGFVCSDLEEMVSAVEKVAGLSRADCREHVERYFSAEAMTDGYEAVYARVLGSRVESQGCRCLQACSCQVSWIPARSIA
jgi:glycosyltransferase involved in cell wall biosynthesis